MKIHARTEAKAEVDKGFFSLALNTKDPKLLIYVRGVGQEDHAEQFLSQLKE